MMQKTQRTHKLDDMLAYQAPYLVDRLVSNGIANDRAEAERLFLELKRYLFICNAYGDISWNMHSLRIDEVWHQFILYTFEYVKFCQEYFGYYVQHAPTNAPEIEGADQSEKREPSTFSMFEEAYEYLFHEPRPDDWFDWKNIGLGTRIRTDKVFTLSPEPDHGEVCLLDDGLEVFRVSDVAKNALGFMVDNSPLYVRELPDLSDEEKVGLVSTLVRVGLAKLLL